MKCHDPRPWAAFAPAAMFCTLALLAAHPAVAQTPAGHPPDADATVRARAGVAALGKTWDAAAFKATVELYTEVHRAIAWPGVLDPDIVHYGSDAQQTFRLFRPEQDFSEPGPVLLFLHGNGLGEEDALVPGSDGLIYSHVGKLAAGFGGIGIVANYRTRGPAAYREGAEDLRLVLEWIASHVAKYGGDAGTVVLLANSEGATNAVAYLFDEDLQMESGPGVAVAVLSSGLFGDAAPGLASLVAAYSGPRVPLALWSGEYDTDRVSGGVTELYEQLCRKYEGCPWREQFPGHNQVSAIMSLGTSDSMSANALIRFYHTVR